MKTSKSVTTTLTLESFWNCVHILITKPHVINKRLWGSKICFKFYCKPNDPAGWILPAACDNLEDTVTDENVAKHVTNMLKALKINIFNERNDFELILIELIPKAYTEKQAYQLAFIMRNKGMVSFYNVTPASHSQNLCPHFTYTLQLNCNDIILTAYDDGQAKSYYWLSNTLLPQFIKWGKDSNPSKPSLCTDSLTLISKCLYYEKYNNLKLKYGKDMVKIWPECTDASKFVYEDVAIAAYLLLLWDQDNSKKKKTFVDLGCGNGLLVYILTKEGHSGSGIDVRKRNIWDMYPPEVLLQERTITPSDASLFPDVDCVIGNHSDELTPWIPVIAAKSSFKCNFFLLPCCAYNFDGSKYQRKNSYNSQYIDYLGHIKQLSEDCGFHINIDRLKIPSTKRICLVSNGRIYSEKEYEKYCQKIDNIISSDSNVSQDFKARESVERVRNCTQVDKDVIGAIVTCITNYLLKDCSELDTTWSIGKSAGLNELVGLISKDLLNKLKSECGGLQTLLKNNHHIFKVQNGVVELRYPQTIEAIKSKTKQTSKRKSNKGAIKIQQRPCWFYSNHPQGCPLNDKECSFFHNECK